MSLSSFLFDRREWAPQMARQPLPKFDEATVAIRNTRNFRYNCGLDGSAVVTTAAWETRRYDIRQVEHIDFILVPFPNTEELAHTMMSFGFSDGRYLSVSVEARRHLGDGFSVIRGSLGYYPLIYIIADERDTIGERVECRGNEVFLYRSNASPLQARALLIDVLYRARHLRRHPERYNTLWNNCLTNIRDHVNHVWPGRVPWNWRQILTGRADILAYEMRLLATTETFHSSREHARITELARDRWMEEDFSKIIREGLA